MAYVQNPAICNQTLPLQLGGFYAPQLEGPTPAGPAMQAVNQAAQRGIMVPAPAPIPLGVPFVRPLGTKNNAAGNNSAHYLC